MKKLLLILSGVFLCGCSSLLDDTPICEDSNIHETIIEILDQNRNQLTARAIDRNVGVYETLNTTNTRIDNIMTKEVNKELKYCYCEGTITIIRQPKGGNSSTYINFSAQKNSAGETIVNIEDVGVFKYDY